jgi:hypothetical protein
MRLKALALAAGLAVGAACLPQAASAAALPGAAAFQSRIDASLTEEVRHRRWHRPHRYGRCSHVRRSCGARFGWGSFRYRRCVIRRGC